MAPLLLGVLLGTGAQLQQAELSAWWLYGAAVAIGLGLVAVAVWGKYPDGARALLPLAIALLAAALLVAGLCGLRAVRFASHALDPALEGRDLVLTGVVAAMPQRNEAGLRFRLKTEAAHLDGKQVTVPPLVYLGWYGNAPMGSGADASAAQSRTPPELRAGERWRLTARLKAPHGGSNPHGFDYELWLWEQGVGATGTVRSNARESAPQRIGLAPGHWVERARQSVRDAVLERVTERRAAGILAALIVGDQAAIDRADWDVFRATGVAHLMSISGLHVTMFAWASAIVVGWLWRRSGRLCLLLPAPTAALLGGLLLALAYALFSGWGVPSQRTVLMLAAVTVLRASGRLWPWPYVWLLACAVVLLADPWAMLQAGFWLSFVAVAVLFASGSDELRHAAAHHTASAADDFAPTASPTPTPSRWQLLRQRAAELMREQWLVTLALTPLTLIFFGQVSLVGMLANLVAIPWVTVIVTPLAMLGVLLPPLWDLAALCVQALAYVLQALAALPWATVEVAAAPPWAGAAGIVGGLLLVLRLPWSWRALGVPLMLPVLLWQPPRPGAGNFELIAADVGQGNAVIVRTAQHSLVYDAGPRYSRETDAGHRVVVPLLRALGEQVNTVVLSHRDSDHTGGAKAVLAMQKNAALLSSIEDDHELQSLRPATRCVAGQSWQWDGVRFEVLHPSAQDYASDTPRKPNALSCVLRIQGRQHSALLVGDIELAQEASLVRNAQASASTLKSDFLLVPHHGSKTSSSPEFLDAVSPQLAFVQAGYRNRFNHPSPDVVQRYRERGTTVLDTASCGALRWPANSGTGYQCQRDVSLRYWHHRLP